MMKRRLPDNGIDEAGRFDMMAKVGFVLYSVILLVGIAMGHYPSMFEVLTVLAVLAIYSVIKNRGRLPDAPPFPDIFRLPWRKRERDRK